jgi:hypothetical protein
MNAPRFDLTINLGHLISITAVVITMVFGWANFDARLTRVEETLRTSTATLVEQVKQGTELRAMDQRLARVERIMETRE